MKRIHLFLFSVAAGINAACLGLTGFFYTTLPEKIPTHFNFSGVADAWTPKTPLMAFFVPIISIIIFTLFAVLYRHPQYTSWPTTLVLMTLTKEKREAIFSVLRGMNAWMILWITVLFMYIQFLIISTANNRQPASSNYVMGGIMVLVLLIIIVTNVRMIQTVYRIKNEK